MQYLSRGETSNAEEGDLGVGLNLVVVRGVCEGQRKHALLL